MNNKPSPNFSLMKRLFISMFCSIMLNATMCNVYCWLIITL